MDLEQRDKLIKLTIAAGGAFAGYQFLYKPWAARRELDRITQAAIQANLAKGMSLEEATEAAIAGACTAAAMAKLKMPPEMAYTTCKGVGILATKGLELAGKGALIVGKALGKGTVAVGKGIGKGVVAVAYKAPKAVILATGHGVVAAGKGVGKAAVAVGYKAPVAVGKGIGKGTVAVGKAAVKAPVAIGKAVVKAPKVVLIKAPKAVLGLTARTGEKTVSKLTAPLGKVVGKIVPKPVAKVIKAPVKIAAKAASKVVHGFGLWGVDEDTNQHAQSYLAELSAPPSHRPNPLSARSVHRAAGGQPSPARNPLARKGYPTGVPTVTRVSARANVTPRAITRRGRRPNEAISYYSKHM